MRTSRDRVPLCVHVYNRILDDVLTGPLAGATQLPGEVSLAQQYGVSRTVVREALLLLAEDGYLERSQGRRWSVAERRTDAVSFSDGLEMLIGSRGLRAHRLQTRIVPADAFTRAHFGSDTPLLLWETILISDEDDAPVASALEFVPVTHASAELLSAAADSSTHTATRAADSTRPAGATQPAGGSAPLTLLDALDPGRRARMTPALWRVAQASARTERLSWMPLGRGALPIVLTVGLMTGGEPAYLAKHIVDLARTNLTVDLLPGTGADRRSPESAFTAYAVAGVQKELI